jgi:hypothetical protein
LHWPRVIIRFGLRQAKDLGDEALARVRTVTEAYIASTKSNSHATITQNLLLWKETERQFFVQVKDRESILSSLRDVAPKAQSQIVAKADHICEHVFDLLGSGSISLGDKIDWHTDFKTGHRWNPRTYHKRIRPAPYPGGYDIKVPWELSRCQHFVWLGQAYWFTGDEKYAQEFAGQVLNWIEQNRPQFGVNWARTMDVAIRAVNWLWGYYFFKDSPTLNGDFLLAFFKSLLVHGRHIFRNLENQGDFPGNHYLSNLLGLIYLGILCPEFQETQRWREFGLQELEKEMFKQVYPDGVDFEASTSYHRLATELFLSAVLLAQLNGQGFSRSFMDRLERMIEFTMYVTRPDGTVPLIGDSDNGRLHRLKVWKDSEREWIDHRYLLAVGAVLFEREDFAQAAGDQWEEAVWLYGDRALVFKRAVEAKRLPLRLLGSRTFPDAGIYVMRSDDSCMVVDAGPIGQNGKGGHAHNDTFSFELYTEGHLWIVDPGTYIYTADYESRNLFRSTASHNTVRVDGHELCRFMKAQLFRLRDDDRPTVHRWKTSADHDLLDVSHHGYERLGQPVTHRRQIFFDKQERLWLVRDLFTGSERHLLEWFWHFAPSVSLSTQGGTLFACSGDGRVLQMLLTGPGTMRLSIEATWVSYGYGKRVEAPVIHVIHNNSLPLEMAVAFIPTGVAKTDRDRLKRAWKHFEECLAAGESVELALVLEKDIGRC